MIKSNTQTVKNIINKFTGTNGEPAPGTDEFYILKSMWVMMLSEFEGSLKSLVESHIDKVKQKPVNKIHICLLLTHFHPNSEDKLTVNQIVSVHKKNPSEITYAHFTRDYVPKYKSKAVEKLFNALGIFFDEEELTSLKNLDGIGSTRDAIAHGDREIQITCAELKNRLKDIEKIYAFLKKRLKKMQ
jgi:hypothetical protein